MHIFHWWWTDVRPYGSYFFLSLSLLKDGIAMPWYRCVTDPLLCGWDGRTEHSFLSAGKARVFFRNYPWELLSNMDNVTLL